MKKYKLLFITLFISLPFNMVYGQNQDWKPVIVTDESSKTTNFQNFVNIPELNLKVPTQVEIYINTSELKNYSVGVFDNTTKQFIYNFLFDYRVTPTAISGISNISTGELLRNLYDNRPDTFTNFYLNNKAVEETRISIAYSKPIKTSSLNINLDNNVALPNYVTISANINSKLTVVLNKYKPSGYVINFPETEAQEWVIEIGYSQPLRITEINFNDSFLSIDKKGVNFIALPNHTYTIYTNPEIPFNPYSGREIPNIYTNTTAKNIGPKPLSLNMNPGFIPADTDNDKISNSQDNCPNLSNPDQVDINKNNIGDLCEDYDKDNILNYSDNCENVTNYDQKDTDGDKVGDVCDPDESRLTEKYPVLVWGALIFAFLIFIGLLYKVGTKIKNQNNDIEPPTSTPTEITQ